MDSLEANVSHEIQTGLGVLHLHFLNSCLILRPNNPGMGKAHSQISQSISVDCTLPPPTLSCGCSLVSAGCVCVWGCSHGVS